MAESDRPETDLPAAEEKTDAVESEAATQISTPTETIVPPPSPPDIGDEADSEDIASAESEAALALPVSAAESGEGTAGASEPPYVQVSQSRLQSIAVGILLIALGITLVWPVFSGGFILVKGVIIAIIVMGAALSLLAHWLSSGRRARGALFLALTGVLWSILTGVFVLEPERGDIKTGWPLYVAALGGAILLTVLGDRQRDRRFIPPGLVLTMIGVVGVLVTRDILPERLTGIARDVSPWLFIILALGLLPLIVRRVPRNG
jgi:hypothetical protein